MIDSMRLYQELSKSYMPSFFDLYSRYFVKISSTVGERGSLTSCTKENSLMNWYILEDIFFLMQSTTGSAVSQKNFSWKNVIIFKHPYLKNKIRAFQHVTCTVYLLDWEHSKLTLSCWVTNSQSSTSCFLSVDGICILTSFSRDTLSF